MTIPMTDPMPDAPVSAPELRQMWLTVLRQPWRSVALVPAAGGVSTSEVSAALEELTRVYELGSFRFLDAGQAGPRDASRIAAQVLAAADEGARTVIALDAPLANVATVPLLGAVDAAILVVRLGSTRLDQARATLDVAGRDRFLGCVAIR